MSRWSRSGSEPDSGATQRGAAVDGGPIGPRRAALGSVRENLRSPSAPPQPVSALESAGLGPPAASTDPSPPQPAGTICATWCNSGISRRRLAFGPGMDQQEVGPVRDQLVGDGQGDRLRVLGHEGLRRPSRPSAPGLAAGGRHRDRRGWRTDLRPAPRYRRCRPQSDRADRLRHKAGEGSDRIAVEQGARQRRYPLRIGTAGQARVSARGAASAGGRTCAAPRAPRPPPGRRSRRPRRSPRPGAADGPPPGWRRSPPRRPGALSLWPPSEPVDG